MLVSIQYISKNEKILIVDGYQIFFQFTKYNYIEY